MDRKRSVAVSGMTPLSEAGLAAWLFAFARLAGWTLFDPLSGRLPLYLRLGFAAALAAALAPGLVAPPAVAGPGLVPALAIELVWGAMLAVCVWLVFAVAQLALSWVGHTATGGLLTLTAAQAGPAEAPWRALAGWLAVLAFLGAGGHLLVVAALRDSFAAMPLAMLPAPETLSALAGAAAWLFAAGFQLALPLLALALLIQLAFGILARTTPGLDMFSAGLGLAAFGLLAVWIAAVPWVSEVMGAGLTEFIGWLGVWRTPG